MKVALSALLGVLVCTSACGPAAKLIIKGGAGLIDEVAGIAGRSGDDLARVVDDVARSADDLPGAAKARPAENPTLLVKARPGQSMHAHAEQAALEARSATCVAENVRIIGQVTESTRRTLQDGMGTIVRLALRRLTNAELRALREGGEKGQEALVKALRGVAEGLKSPKRSWSIDVTKAELGVSIKLPGNGSAKATLPLDKLFIALAAGAGYAAASSTSK
jgi:hypothetical protein